MVNKMDVGALMVVVCMFLILVSGVVFVARLKHTVRSVRVEIGELDSRIALLTKELDISEVNKTLSLDSAKVKVLADKYLAMSFIKPDQVIEMDDLRAH